MSQAILKFLEKDRLKNIVLLKMLHAFDAQIETHFEQKENSSAVLLLLPTRAFYYDAKTYPQTEYVVLFSTDNLAHHQSLLDRIPTGCNLVFKLMDRDVQIAIASRFDLHRVTAFRSYTTLHNSNFTVDEEVAVATQVDEACLSIYEAQGHPAATVRKQFAEGEAVNFVLRQNGHPVSSCFAYRNYEPVWEIGGVWTDPLARRGGFARRVVSTALHTLTQQQRTPRYQVHEINLPSIHLAEALGLQCFVTMEHFLYEARKP